MQFYHKYKHFFNILLKLVLFCLLFWALYKQVFYDHSWQSLYEHLDDTIRLDNLILLGLILLLMMINWGIETYKWQVIIRQSAEISLFNACKGVLGGVTLSSIMPNRVGEYIGRVFFIDVISRSKALSLTFIGIISQLIIVGSMGGVGAIFYISQYMSVPLYIELLMFVAGLLLMTAILYLYFNVQLLPRWIHRWKKFRKIEQYIEIIRNFQATTLGYILLLTGLRYLVFSMQYWLLLQVFGVEVGLLTGLLLIAFIFFLQMAIPYPTLAELGVRGNVALFVLGAVVTGLEANIISATFMLWLINLVFPALAGSYFVLAQKFFK